MTDERKKPLKLSRNMVTVSFKGGPINPIEDGPPAAYHPPICPKCNEPVEFIDYYEESVWKYNPEHDSYDNTSLYGGSARVQCSQCNYDVGELFPEGPANYGHQLKGDV